MWRSLAALARAALIEGKETNAQAKQAEEEKERKWTQQVQTNLGEVRCERKQRNRVEAVEESRERATF